MGWLIKLMPSSAAIWAALAGAAAASIAWLTRSARNRAVTDLKQMDHDHAEIIEERVSRSRADDERLRPFDGAGWRD